MKKVEEDKKQAEDALKVPKEVEDEAQEAIDNEKGKEVETGKQSVVVEPYGRLSFIWPCVGLAMEGDKLVAQFKATHFRKGDMLTEAQMLAIYDQPVTVEVNGENITVGNGAWTKDDERILNETLPEEIKVLANEFNSFRDEIQGLKVQIPVNKKKLSAKEQKLTDRIEGAEAHAVDVYQKLQNKKIDFLQLQSKRTSLFATSLEEMAGLEKLKLYAPNCIIKEDDEPLWPEVDDMLSEGYEALKVIGLFSMFLKGADVSFFGDMQDEEITS